MTQQHRKKKLDDLEIRCLKYLKRARWPEGLRCIKQDADDPCLSRRFLTLHRKARGLPRIVFQCRRCRIQFRAATGTIFERSHIPLYLWFTALLLLGVDTRVLSDRLRLPYKTAWTLRAKLLREKRKANKDLLAVLEERAVQRIGSQYMLLSNSMDLWSRSEMQRLLSVITQAGKSQRDIAKRIECSQYAVWTWLHGKVKQPILINRKGLRRVSMMSLGEEENALRGDQKQRLATRSGFKTQTSEKFF